MCCEAASNTQLICVASLIEKEVLQEIEARRKAASNTQPTYPVLSNTIRYFTMNCVQPHCIAKRRKTPQPWAGVNGFNTDAILGRKRVHGIKACVGQVLMD